MPVFLSKEEKIDVISASQEGLVRLRQHLKYYNASVYKAEALMHMNACIHTLRLTTLPLGIDAINECFRDYEAMTLLGQRPARQGDCAVSMRIGRLIADLEMALRNLDDTEIDNSIKHNTHTNVLRDGAFDRARLNEPRSSSFRKI